jgi:flagellar protein FliO/FliZ
MHDHPAVVIGSAVPSLGAGGILQAVLGLIVVIAIVFGCGWLARRFGLQPSMSGRKGGTVKVVGSASVGTRERVVVVEIADTWLVLGVAAGSVRRLHTLPVPTENTTEETPVESEANPSFQTAFARQLRARFRGQRDDA